MSCAVRMDYIFVHTDAGSEREGETDLRSEWMNE